MNPAEFTWRSNEARRRGIRFLSPNELGQRPNPHEERFAHITELGNKSCDSFLQTISPNFSTKPWRTELPKRAERLSKLADRCYHEDDGNESGWRFKVENEIMYRFTVEVTWVWDSEIPAATTGLNEAREMLEHRRRNRQPCRCPKNWGDDFDREINVLFSDRAEARIKHIPALQIPSQRPRKSELMDRIYGLRQTENFRFILDSSDKRYIETSNIPLRESIKCSPLELRGGEPLLFPFLIVEAKSSKGRSRAETHMQSAFCIQQVLKIQRDLVIAAGNEIQWETEPLIWYIATRGEQWDVYAGFIEDDQNTTQYYHSSWQIYGVGTYAIEIQLYSSC
ncbi:hypothetical protein N7456_012017 [Penicillium angulare]|uniref:Uncharacterized protein n=1 Tax=Penicillium angulare TaxID=116970 RepID=A0A9W9EUZ2_9EURO|nr:hypothetical protein N7456_012017 [Penicillium angulare]